VRILTYSTALCLVGALNLLVISTSLAAASIQVTKIRQILPLSGSYWQYFGSSGINELPDFGTPAFFTAPWKNISVPHNFQTRRDMSVDQGWYRRNIVISPALSRKHLYIVFEGAATIADVYVNGHYLGEHRGAYTRFIFDATTSLHIGAGNILAIKVDNRPISTTDCLPSASGLYTVWGGLYRHVWLLATNDLQIDPTYFASPGVFITPTLASPTLGKVDIKVLLRNTSSMDKNALVKANALSPSGKIVASTSNIARVDTNGRCGVHLSLLVNNPRLWSPSSPNLYHVRIDVGDHGVLSDSITQPLGFHSIKWDFTHGLLTLNGKPYVLYGVDLHQEIETKQSAVAPSDLIANFDAMQDLGVNFVRLAHYPRAQIEYDLCDQRGIFCWAENGHSHDDIPTPTADQITTEMVEQNYNHPSIILWSVGNEGNAPPAEREVPIVKAIDITRPVVVANMHCDNADYRAANAYPGWYQNWNYEVKGLISEIGGGGVVTTHCDYSAASHIVDGYEPEEYQQIVAETDFENAFRKSAGKLGMFTWWTLREFNDYKYKHEIAPFGHGINSKGLETYCGFKKDVYYLYRCFLRPDVPTVHITSKLYFLRCGKVDNGIKVYSNAKSLKLLLNGRIVSTLDNGDYQQNYPPNTSGVNAIDNVFYWPIPLHVGKNYVTATDGIGHSDSAVVYFYGADGLPEIPERHPLITGLTSSNPENQPYFIDDLVHAQWPIYDDLDSTADNSLDTIPTRLIGARWIALHRVTKPGEGTNVGFTPAQPLTVYVIDTKQAVPPSALQTSGFAPVKTPPFQWRGNDLILVDAELWSKSLAAGQKVSIRLGERDALILLQPNGRNH
jgi:beta-galactosidase